MSARDKKLIYHLTALRNLPSIAEHGVLPRAELARRGLAHIDVGEPEIRDTASWVRRVASGLDETVPFHFVPKTPFAYQVARSNARGPVVLLCVRRDVARRRGYGIFPTDPLARASPSVRPPEVLAWNDGFALVEWDRIDARGEWRTDPRTKSAMMAEAISFESVPVADIAIAFVPTGAALAEAQGALGVASDILLIENEWMFPPAAR